jgi:hypothetical protein
VLFDQSREHNDLEIAGPGGNGNQNVGVVANELRIIVGGHHVYGMSFNTGMGYRDNNTEGVATGAQPESMYMVTAGAHSNSQCCFDFGNAETNSHDTGDGHMDAIYFGSHCSFAWPSCYGSGPWVQADMENGLFFSDTAMLKNNGTDTFAIKAANAQTGPLAKIWSGPLPQSSFDTSCPSATIPSPNKPTEPAIVNPPLACYRPMKKEGAIILGTGGDDSNYAVGSFFEGVMTTGYATDRTDNAVQANITSAGYGSRLLRCLPADVRLALPRGAKVIGVTINRHRVRARHRGRQILLTVPRGIHVNVVRVTARTRTARTDRRIIRAACTASS